MFIWTYLKQSGSYTLIPAEFLKFARLLFQWLQWKGREKATITFVFFKLYFTGVPNRDPKQVKNINCDYLWNINIGYHEFNDYLLNPTILSGTLTSSVARALGCD